MNIVRHTVADRSAIVAQRRSTGCKPIPLCRFSLALLTLLVLLAAGDRLGAQGPRSNRLVKSLALPSTAPQIDGFLMTIRLDGIDQPPGYLRLRLAATAATGTFAANRTLTVSLEPSLRGDESLGNEPAGVRLNLLLKQGQRGATQEVFMPRWTLHGGYHVTVSQQGRPLPGYDGDLGRDRYVNSRSARGSLEVTHRMGVVLAREVQEPAEPWQVCPDLRWINTMHDPDRLVLTDLAEPLPTPRQRIAALDLGEGIVDRVLLEDELPERWLAYDHLDILLAPLPLLERLAVEQPPRWRAVRQWVAAGGNLWVYAAEDRPRLARLLETGRPATTAIDPLYVRATGRFNQQSALQDLTDHARRETGLGATNGGRRYGGGYGYSGYGSSGYGGDGTGAMNAQAIARRQTQLDSNLYQLGQAPSVTPRVLADRIWAQPYLAGQVIGIADEQPFPGSLQLWHVASQLTAHRASAAVRRGVDVTAGDSRFWNWVLPNVAQPPIYSFLALLAGFAILVGPVAYRKTSLAGRPYLMFLIAPVLAVLTTVLMFGYGLLADGLGVQARIRQITLLDGASGHGVQWTRSTYFAALRTSQGLTFPADAAVFPYPQNRIWMGRRKGDEEESAPAIGWITLTEDHQQLGPNFLPSRRQRQFLTLQPRDSLGRIELQPPSAGAQQTLLRNASSLQVVELLARDSAGEYWLVGDAPADGTATAVRVPPATASMQLRNWYSLQRPEPPAGFDTGNRRLMGGLDLVSEVLRDNHWEVSALDGLFEEHLRSFTLLNAQLPPGSFLGVATIGEDALALPSADLSDSIHYVMGTLP